MRAGIAWTRRDEEGNKLHVFAERFGGVWTFRTRQRRNENWQALAHPPLEDWLELLDGVRRRVPRRLFSPTEIDNVRKAIRERFPEASDF